MSLRIAADDGRLRWPGAVSLERTDKWVMPWRAPVDKIALFPPEGIQNHMAMPAGVRLTFRSDTTLVAGSVVPQEEVCNIDLCCDGEVAGSAELAGKDGFRFDQLPCGDKLIELWLPQVGRFQLRSLELSDGADVSPYEDPRPCWITYGSSISQCGAAESPAYTWPAIVARERGLNLTCLGFGGQCHLDSMIARMIRDLPADLISMCVGINIHGQGSLNARSFKPAIIGFVQIIRERHPDTPLVVISPIISPPRETAPNVVGFTLREMREEVADAVSRLRAHGDRNLHYVDGLELFGEDCAKHLPDDVHPDAEGYKVLGSRFLEKVIARVFP